MIFRSLVFLVVAFLAAAASPVRAENGPYASLVAAGEGVEIDVDVRWPDTGSPPEEGWPVIFWTHGCGGTKASVSGFARDYANDGYVTVAYTNRPNESEERLPEYFANDIVAIKNWLINDFESEATLFYGATVEVPVDPDRFGMSGSSLGGYTTWSGGLLTDAFATIVPRNWAMHAFSDHIVQGGSIERQTGAPPALLQAPTIEYPAAELQAGLDAVFGTTLAEYPNVTIPVFNLMAMLDSRTSGTVALQDHLALTGAAQRMVYLGTGGHATPNDDAIFREELMERWFEFHLKGTANGIGDEESIRMALLVTNEKLSWSSWPPPGQQLATVYLHEGQTLRPSAPAGSQPADSFVNDPGSSTWFNVSPTFNVGDLRAALPRETVLYETAPLTEEVLLVGQPEVDLHVAGTGSRYQVNVHLYEVDPSGEPTLLAFGTQMLSESPALAEVTLSVTGRRVPAGHALRLEVTNRDDQDLNHTNGFQPLGNQLRYTPFFEYSETSVFHDSTRPSSLRIPLIGRSDLPLEDAGCDTPGAPDCALVRTSLFKILDDDTPPISTRKRKLTFKSSGSRDTPSGVTEPAFGSEGDPTAAGASGGGATLTVYRVGGDEEDVKVHTLPADLWSQTGREDRPGYRYRDNDAIAGPIKKVVLGRGKMTITAKGDGVYELAGAPQQAMALRLELGTGTSFCASAPARSPAEKFDSTRKFDAEKNSPAPVACPPIPGTSSYGSASAAFLAGSPGLLH